METTNNNRTRFMSSAIFLTCIMGRPPVGSPPIGLILPGGFLFNQRKGGEHDTTKC